VAYGQKSEKIYFENLREYFRIVFAFSALFSQYNRFWIAKRRGRGEKDENWLAVRAFAWHFDVNK
jgi:hypothetical protein